MELYTVDIEVTWYITQRYTWFKPMWPDIVPYALYMVYTEVTWYIAQRYTWFTPKWRDILPSAIHGLHRSDLIYCPALYTVYTEVTWYIAQRYTRFTPKWHDILPSAIHVLRNVLEKVLTDFGKLFQMIWAVWLNERFDILREGVGRSRVGRSKERVEPVGLIFIRFLRYWRLRSIEKEWMNKFYILYPDYEIIGSSAGVYSPAVDGN